MKPRTPTERLREIRRILGARRAECRGGATNQWPMNVAISDIRRIYRLTQPAPKRGKAKGRRK